MDSEQGDKMPINKRPEGSYQVAVSIGGREVRQSSRRWTYQDAKKVERDLLLQAKDYALGIEPERTIAEGLERFLLEHVPRLRSAKKLESHARQLLPFIIGRKLSETGQVWASIKASLKDKAPATINHKGRILRQIVRLSAEDWGWMDKPVKLSLLQETPKETFLSLAQVNALAAAMPTEAGKGYLLLAAYTGIRRSHLLRLTRDDVEGGYIYLDRSSKNRKLQVIPIHKKVSKYANQLPLCSDWILRNEWDIARAKLKMMHVRWHDLRHTYASLLIEGGTDIRTVQALLGHSTITQTQRYAHLRDDGLSKAVAKLK